MQVPNIQVRTYVHGTLYSLLSRPSVREQAHQRGLADSLRAVSATSEPVFQRHIDHILARLEDEAAEEEQSDDEAEQEDDVDVMEYDDEYNEMEEVLSSGVRRRSCFKALANVHSNFAFRRISLDLNSVFWSSRDILATR